MVEDPSSVDVDATTSASVLAPGNAAKLAAWIQEVVGGDLHSIVVKEPYSSDYDQCLDWAAEEKADNARPALTTNFSAKLDVEFYSQSMSRKGDPYDNAVAENFFGCLGSFVSVFGGRAH